LRARPPPRRAHRSDVIPQMVQELRIHPSTSNCFRPFEEEAKRLLPPGAHQFRLGLTPNPEPPPLPRPLGPWPLRSWRAGLDHLPRLTTLNSRSPAWLEQSTALEAVFSPVWAFWSSPRRVLAERRSNGSNQRNRPEPGTAALAANVFSRAHEGGQLQPAQLAVGGVGGPGGLFRSVRRATTRLLASGNQGWSEKADPGHQPERTELHHRRASRRSVNGLEPSQNGSCDHQDVSKLRAASMGSVQAIVLPQTSPSGGADRVLLRPHSAAAPGPGGSRASRFRLMDFQAASIAARSRSFPQTTSQPHTPPIAARIASRKAVMPWARIGTHRLARRPAAEQACPLSCGRCHRTESRFGSESARPAKEVVRHQAERARQSFGPFRGRCVRCPLRRRSAAD